jgi:CheY-like chemotaxis protein
MGNGGSRVPSVLFVGADSDGRLPLQVCLNAAGFEVRAVGSEVEALSDLTRFSVDLVIGDGDTLSLFTPALGRRLKPDSGRPRIPLLVLARDATFASRAADLALVVGDLLTRPVWARELVARAQLLLQRQLQSELASPEVPARAVIQGNLDQVSVSDLLHSVGFHRRSGLIRIAGPKGHAGKISFRDGRAVAAEMGTLRGKDAVYQLLAFHQGHFQVEWGAVADGDVIAMHPRGLVLEGTRRLLQPAPASPREPVVREPGVERRGTILSGTIRNNRGTGDTAVVWASPLVPAIESRDESVSPVRSRSRRPAVLGAVLGTLTLALLVPERHRLTDRSGSLAARDTPPGHNVFARPRVAALPTGSGPRDAAAAVKACRDVSALGNAAQTVEHCNRAFRALPDSALIAAVLARAEVDLGHYERAAEWAHKAVGIDPSMAEPYAYLGFAADQAGYRQEAHAAYQRYLELDPRGPYADDINAILGTK